MVMTRRVTGVLVLAGLAGLVGLVASPPIADARPSPAVSYTAPPTPLTLVPFARILPPPGAELSGAQAAVAEDGVSVVVDIVDATGRRPVAYYAANSGAVSAPVPLAVGLGAVVPGPDHVLYGLAADPATGQPAVVAVPMGGPRLGQVIAARPLADPAPYLEPGPVPFGNTAAGIVDLALVPGTLLIGHVDQNGNPLSAPGLPTTYLRRTATAIIDTGPPDAWDITIERPAGYAAPYGGEAPPARSAHGVNVWATYLGLSPEPGVADPTLPVLAVLRPGQRTVWFSVGDGWRYASSDVWGTIFLRAAADGAIEVARVDAATLTGGPAAAPAAPPPVCPDYVDHVEHRYPLRLCDSGLFVTYVQGLLATTHGYTDLVIDGYYGPLTEAAVRDFQAAHGLAADGLTGPLTWAALIAPSPGAGVDTDGSGLVDPWELFAD